MVFIFVERKLLYFMFTKSILAPDEKKALSLNADTIISTFVSVKLELIILCFLCCGQCALLLFTC